MLLLGEYRTAVERNPCAAGTTHSSVYGLRNYTDNDSTLAFFVVWRNGASMTGWVGKCTTVALLNIITSAPHCKISVA